ncbi:hypothetical protein RCL1_006106 [Eukaryota sp. TZLM3-RCL]
MSIEFTQPIAEKFISLREKQLFCDLTFKLANNSEVQCHSHVLAAHCKLLSNNEASFIEVPDFKGLTLDLFSEVMNVLYGKGSLIVNKSNCRLLQKLGQLLKCEKLTRICSIVSSSTEQKETKKLSVSPQDILIALRRRDCDCTITYRGVSVEIHRFLLAAFFDYFVEKWTLDCPDRDDVNIDFSDKFQFSSADFMSFFNNLYDQVLIFDEQFFYTFYHLSGYFKYSELTLHMTSVLPSLEPSKIWITQVLSMVNDYDDLEFLELFVEYLNNCHGFLLDKPMILKPHILNSLCRGLQGSDSVLWAVQSLVLCYKAHAITSSDISECLASLNITSSDAIAVYNLLANLRNDEQLCEALVFFFSDTILPCLSRGSSSINPSKLLKKCNEIELSLNRDRIFSLYQHLGSTTNFYGTNLSWEKEKSNNKAIVCPAYSDTTAFIAHPLDGEVIITFSRVWSGSQVGFKQFHSESLSGFSFHDSTSYKQLSLYFDGSFVGYCSYDCQVLLSFKFSKSQVVAFKLLSPLIECSAEVPLHSDLCVHMPRGSGCGSCAVRLT